MRTLRCRLYSCSLGTARLASITTRCRNKKRYPFAESMLTNAVLQPYIHDIDLHLYEGNDKHHYVYRVFFKRHRLLPLNRSIRSCAFRGDAVILRVGLEDVVNMRGRDTSLADYVMLKCVDCVCSSFRTTDFIVCRFARWLAHRRRCTRYPRTLTFYKA